MMKIIKLTRVHYLSWKGITLTINKPFVEATEENLEKLEKYLKLGVVEIKEMDENDKEDEYEATDMSAEEATYVEEYDKPIITTRCPTKETLEQMNKKEIMEELEKFHIEYKKNMKKEELIELFS